MHSLQMFADAAPPVVRLFCQTLLSE